jgi:phage terminase large subunit-like protein
MLDQRHRAGLQVAKRDLGARLLDLEHGGGFAREDRAIIWLSSSAPFARLAQIRADPPAAHEKPRAERDRHRSLRRSWGGGRRAAQSFLNS